MIAFRTNILLYFQRFTIRMIKRRSLFLVLYVVFGAITVSPLRWARVPPLVDYPNHLARMWILIQDGRLSELAANYKVHWRILPDLAMDLAVPALSQIMPFEQAGQVFIASTMLTLIAGTLVLHRALHGRLEIWPLFSILFVYNAALFWGFLNCLFATGVCLLVFSGWIAASIGGSYRDFWLFPPRRACSYYSICLPSGCIVCW